MKLAVEDGWYANRCFCLLEPNFKYSNSVILATRGWLILDNYTAIGDERPGAKHAKTNQLLHVALLLCLCFAEVSCIEATLALTRTLSDLYDWLLRKAVVLLHVVTSGHCNIVDLDGKSSLKGRQKVDLDGKIGLEGRQNVAF